jgi:hypothetical protein
MSASGSRSTAALTGQVLRIDGGASLGDFAFGQAAQRQGDQTATPTGALIPTD